MTKGRKSIILADDSKTFAMYFSILLKRIGFDVTPVENGLEALKLIKVMEPHLVILDIRMPVMDGITALRLLKEDKMLSGIPVVMVSTETDKKLVENCEKIGCAGFITKPVNIDRVHEVLQECLYETRGFKRKHIRASFHKKVTLIENDLSYELYAVNLSEGGIYLTTIDPLPIGSKVRVALPLNNEKSLSLDATITYVKSLYGDLFKNPPGMALEFRNLTDNDSAILQDYVKEMVANDILDSNTEVIEK